LSERILWSGRITIFEMTLFVSLSIDDIDHDSQTVFEKDKFYSVGKKIVPEFYCRNKRLKMMVSTSMHLTILNKVVESNKCPLKVSLIEVPQDMPNEINDEIVINTRRLEDGILVNSNDPVNEFRLGLINCSFSEKYSHVDNFDNFTKGLVISSENKRKNLRIKGKKHMKRSSSDLVNEFGSDLTNCSLLEKCSLINNFNDFICKNLTDLEYMNHKSFTNEGDESTDYNQEKIEGLVIREEQFPSKLCPRLLCNNEHVEFELISKGILNPEYAIRPLDINKVTIPKEAVASTTDEVEWTFVTDSSTKIVIS
ncbi:7979_t:CDS:2, partial [Diversispora eburnea]